MLPMCVSRVMPSAGGGAEIADRTRLGVDAVRDHHGALARGVSHEQVEEGRRDRHHRVRLGHGVALPGANALSSPARQRAERVVGPRVAEVLDQLQARAAALQLRRPAVGLKRMPGGHRYVDAPLVDQPLAVPHQVASPALGLVVVEQRCVEPP